MVRRSRWRKAVVWGRVRAPVIMVGRMPRTRRGSRSIVAYAVVG